jgi:hypothetical protein
MNRYILSDCSSFIVDLNEFKYFIIKVSYIDYDVGNSFVSQRIIIARGFKEAFKKWSRHMNKNYRSIMKAKPEYFHYEMNLHNEVAIFFFMKSSHETNLHTKVDRLGNVCNTKTYDSKYYNEQRKSPNSAPRVDGFTIELMEVGKVTRNMHISHRFRFR